MIDAEQAEKIRTPALHETQIARVIDDAGKIRVLVIDADGHDVPAVFDPAREVGPVLRHLYSSP